jgi:hypothetical protein
MVLTFIILEIKMLEVVLLIAKTDIYCDQLSSILEGMWEKKETLKNWNKKEVMFA